MFLSILTVPVSAQKVEDSIAKKRIIADFNTYINRFDKEAYINHCRILKEAVKLTFTQVELACYDELAKDHSYGILGKSNLDSTIYYFDKFESRIRLLDSSDLEIKYISTTIVKHYANKGFILGDLFGLKDLAIESELKAEPYLDKVDKNTYTKYVMQLSSTYNLKKKYDKSLELLNRQLNDTASLNEMNKQNLFQRIGEVYLYKKMPEQSLYYFNKSLLLAKIHKLEYSIWFCKNEMTYSYFLMGDHQKAIDSALAIREFYKTAKKKYRTSLNSNAEYLSDFYYGIGNIDRAITYAKAQLELNVDGATAKAALENLAKYAMEKNDYQSAMAYYKKRDKITDSLRSVEKDLLIKYSVSNMKLMKQEQINQSVMHENELLEKNNAQQKLYSLIIGSVLISLLLLLGGVFVYKKYKESKKVVTILKANEKELLEEQIRLRDNELDASAIALSQRVEVLNTIKMELAAIKDDNPKLAQVNKTVKNLIRSSSDIALVTDRIESQYPTLTIELKNQHPEISDTEIRYCLLTKLNLSLKETATMLNVSPNTVKVTRSRLKKKMNIPQELSFKEYLDKIYSTTVASA